MKTYEIAQRLEGEMMASGHKPNRRYLGMSQIYKAEADLISQLRNGYTTGERHQLLIYGMGYAFERIILEKLVAAGLIYADSSRHLVASFDERFKGHTDAEFTDGVLCEVKSTTEERLARIESSHNLPNQHYVQAQMYMHWGGYDLDRIVYVARDTGRVLVRILKYDARTANNYNEKAKRILATIDNYK